MDAVRVLEVKQSVFAGNDRRADALRQELKAKKLFLLNLMSSPGSGKTATLTRTIGALKDRLRIGVMEADIDSDVDARAISALGVRTIQLHTGGMCHLDAEMTAQGLAGLQTSDLDLAVLRIRHRRREECDDPERAGGRRQAAQVSADVHGVRRRAHQQAGRAAVF